MSIFNPAISTVIGSDINGTPGSVLFVGATGDLDEDNANLFYDESGGKGLRVGSTTILGSFIASGGLTYLGAAGSGAVFYAEETSSGTSLGGVIALGVSHTPVAGTPIGQFLFYGSDGGGGLVVSGNIAQVSEDDWSLNPGAASFLFSPGNAGNGIRVRNNGRLTAGNTDETYGFFVTEETRLLANNEITSIGTSPAPFDIIKILAESAATINPSADTNSGIGITLYAALAGNTKLTGGSNFNGGIPLGAGTDVYSAMGGFGQTSFEGSGTLDGAVGVLFTAAHAGYGGAANLIIGGLFDANTADGPAAGTPTGTIQKLIGGRFSSGGSGIDIVTSVSAQFDEPRAFDEGTGAGTPTITNQTGAFFNGTFSIAPTAVATAANISDLVVPTSQFYFTGSTATAWHGMIADSFNKIVKVTNISSATVTIKNQSATEATAARRFITHTGADYAVTAGNSAELTYDTTTSRWRVTGHT